MSMPEVGSRRGPGTGRRPKNPRNGQLPAKGKRRLYRKDPNRGVHHGVPGIVCEAWKPSPGTGGSPTTPGAHQETNRGQIRKQTVGIQMVTSLLSLNTQGH